MVTEEVVVTECVDTMSVWESWKLGRVRSSSAKGSKRSVLLVLVLLFEV